MKDLGISLMLPALAMFALGCEGDAGPLGNPGPEGPKGTDGPTGPTGPTGTAGAQGEAGMDGQEGGTPFLVSNRFNAVIQYGDGAQVMELFQTTIVAPDSGTLLLRAHFSGLVAKRDGIARCRVQVSLRKNQDRTNLAEEEIGVSGAPLAGKLELSVGTTLIGRVPVTAGERVTTRLEVRRFDDGCAIGAGAERVAHIFGQLDANFFRVPLSTATIKSE